MLLIGYGNPGRCDDGLGPALINVLEKYDLPGVELQSDYQLAADLASDMAAHDRVIFIDAAVSGDAPCFLQAVEPVLPSSFTSHSMAPGELLYLSRHLFGARCKAWVLGILGYEFDRFHEGLSTGALNNLKVAETFLLDLLQQEMASNVSAVS
jgi:hydrogenase maturation protease